MHTSLQTGVTFPPSHTAPSHLAVHLQKLLVHRGEFGRRWATAWGAGHILLVMVHHFIHEAAAVLDVALLILSDLALHLLIVSLQKFHCHPLPVHHSSVLQDVWDVVVVWVS